MEKEQLMKAWDNSQRFHSATEWIAASLGRRGIVVDGDIVGALADCCVKRKTPTGPVFSLRKTDPKGGAPYFVFKAFKFAQHASAWGNLACWGEGFTARLMMATDEERELFSRAFDQFTQGGRNNGDA